MRVFAFATLAFGFGLTALLLAACSNSAEDCAATASCAGGAVAGNAGTPAAGTTAGGSEHTGGSSHLGGGSSGTAGALGSGGAGGEGGAQGSECTGEVADDPACWATNELGVFVSSDTGVDATGDGTRESPYATIGKGLQASGGKNVYVCLGNADFYDEALSLDLALDGARIYGGFECSNWTHSTTRYVGVKPKNANIALRIDGLKEGALIENVRFESANAANPGESSYGAFIVNSKNVTLRRVKLTAGDGAAGTSGGNGVAGLDGAAAGPGQDGEAALCGSSPPDVAGGQWDAAQCGSKGGAGGGAFEDAKGGDGVSGNPKQNISPAPNENGGAGAADASAGASGTDGSSGNAGSSGGAAPVLGAFSATGYLGADGLAGLPGNPGQGGGGGGGSAGKLGCAGASGGAGGLGGCGATGGKAGRGGGASVGLFSWSSSVSLQSCQVAAGGGGGGGDGGDGGGGGLGVNGGTGGKASTAGGIAKGGNGGAGGNGGNGGSGSGGTGGPSFALAYFGTQPVYVVADTSLMPGVGGDAGVGGQVLAASAPNGSVGASAAEYLVP